MNSSTSTAVKAQGTKCGALMERFEDDDLLDRLLAAVASTGGGTSPAMAVADALIDHFRAGHRACDETPERTSERLPP